MTKIIAFGTIVLIWLIIAPAAMACSCYCEYDKMVSEIIDDATLFYGIPTKSELQKSGDDWLRININTEVFVLNDFGKNLGQTVSIVSVPEDGGLCSYQPKVGIPQLITTTKSKVNGIIGFSSCECKPPGAALLQYLKTGKDRFIPDPSKCENTPTLEGCELWDPFSQDDDLHEEQMKYFPFSKHAETLFPELEDR